MQDIALAQKVSRISVWKIWQTYKKWGSYGLRDHKAGRLFEPLNAKFYKKVIDEWQENRCGARKLYAILKKKGFGVSLRKISQVLKTEGFQKPCLKRQKPRKYKRYEWPIANFMWHTDWHVIKAEKLKGQNFISYIDDCSRQIMSHCVFKEMTTKNSLLALYKAIAEHNVTPYELNSDRGSQFIPPKLTRQAKQTANSKMRYIILEYCLFHREQDTHKQMVNWRNFTTFLTPNLMTDSRRLTNLSSGTTTNE